MNIVIIQARMGSSRLPGKVLMEIDGVPLIQYQLDRVKKTKNIDKVVVATTNLPGDDPIEKFCEAFGIDCYRGSEKDVLDRYYQAALIYEAKIVVRLTADCPLSDPMVIDQLISFQKTKNFDYLANTVPPETSFWPDGSDVEIFTIEALARAHREANDIEEREHVTFYFWKSHGTNFKVGQLRNERNWSQYRFTVDYIEDFEVISFLIKELKKEKLFGHVDEIISILKKNKKIVKLNEKYHFGMGWK